MYIIINIHNIYVYIYIYIYIMYIYYIIYIIYIIYSILYIAYMYRATGMETFFSILIWFLVFRLLNSWRFIILASF